MDTTVFKVPLVLAVLVASYIFNVDGCAVTIINSCSYPVTSCARSRADPTARYELSPGKSQRMDFGSACLWPSAVVYASVGGTCQDTNLANIAEFNIGGGTDYYALSNVDAYTIGMQIVPMKSGCKPPVCSIPDIPAFCQPKNKLNSYPTGAYSCHNTDGQIGYPTPNNKRFKEACPDAYSFNKDDATSLWTCSTGTEYNVIFCPKTKTPHDLLDEIAEAAIEISEIV